MLRTVLSVAVASSGLWVVGAAPAEALRQCTVADPQYVRAGSDLIRSLGVPQAWRLATGAGVTVAVVDSGVSAENAHLRTALSRGTSLVPGDGSAGRDDQQGHGTAVAGVIAARNVGKQSSLIGVAYNAHIMSVRVYRFEPTDAGVPVEDPPDTGRIADGIRWAADHGADVINVSMSTGPTDPKLGRLKAAVDHAVRRDVVVVASVGNTRGKFAQQNRYPADFPGVIGVAATTTTGVVDNYSVHGPMVDVSAPGQNVLTTFLGSGDCFFGQDPQTSWAAPFVSGTAALLRERFPRAGAEEIAYRIEASAERPVQSRRDDIEGWGMIRPYDALTMTIDPNRPGPPLPGQAGRPRRTVVDSPIEAAVAGPDPRVPAERAAVWWTIGGVGLTVLALVLRPWVGRRPRRR